MNDTTDHTSGTGPGKPWLPYGIPYPPPLPAKIGYQENGQAHLIDPDWSKHARFFGARDDLWGEGFQTRAYHNDDPTGNGRRFQGDWDVQYRLGNPSNVPWPDVVAKWGLQVLDKAGFINLNLGRPDSMYNTQGRFLPKRPAAWKGDTVHPVFRKDMWKDITDDEYLIMQPALLLASAVLDDPTTMCLLHALVTPSCHSTFQDNAIREGIRIQVPDSLTEAEQQSVFQKLCDMRKWTSFGWEDLHKLDQRKSLAYTVPFPAQPASAKYTMQSRIALSRLYVDALMDWAETDCNNRYRDFFKSLLDIARVPSHRRPQALENDLESAPLRTCLLFAAIIVHEFAHAFRMAYFPLGPASACAEPWVGDSRHNEFGHAIIQHIFSGIPTATQFLPPAGTPWHTRWQLVAHAPLGIFVMEKWEQWAAPGLNKQHRVQGVKADFDSPIAMFPLPQRQVYDYFTENMWKRQVPRFGLDAIRFVKIPDWASHRIPGPEFVKPADNSTLR